MPQCDRVSLGGPKAGVLHAEWLEHAPREEFFEPRPGQHLDDPAQHVNRPAIFPNRPWLVHERQGCELVNSFLSTLVDGSNAGFAIHFLDEGVALPAPLGNYRLHEPKW